MTSPPTYTANGRISDIFLAMNRQSAPAGDPAACEYSSLHISNIMSYLARKNHRLECFDLIDAVHNIAKECGVALNSMPNTHSRSFPRYTLHWLALGLGV